MHLCSVLCMPLATRCVVMQIAFPGASVRGVTEETTPHLPHTHTHPANKAACQASPNTSNHNQM